MDGPHGKLYGFFLYLDWYRSVGETLVLAPAARSVLISMLVLFPGIRLYAGNSVSVENIQRLKGTITFDGMPDEAAWQEISPFRKLTHNPGRLKLLYMYSIKLSAYAFIQYNSAVHSITSFAA